ncbi:MAG: accessory factor UbiK family protein [Gammaproteobacteria bacterium]|nr:MAG: accessory factor UbiK family protein [Gammaproteobacteria bacterium]
MNSRIIARLKFEGTTLDPKILDDLARQLADMVPADLVRLREELQRNFRAALGNVYAKMDLVTREEFDAQSAVLARTREKLEALEAQVRQMEQEA